MNKIILTGIVVNKHPMPNGKCVKLTLVPINDPTEKGNFLEFSTFGNAAKIAETLEKGTRIGVEGHLSAQTTEKDGKKVYYQDAVIDFIEYLEKKTTDSNEEKESGDGK